MTRPPRKPRKLPLTVEEVMEMARRNGHTMTEAQANTFLTTANSFLEAAEGIADLTAEQLAALLKTGKDPDKDLN